MSLINRNSPDDAEKVIENILPHEEARDKFIEFLGNAIRYTNALQSDNWNLNLDRRGRFVRFNVGQEDCIDLNKNRVQVLCNRQTIKPIVERENIPVIFRGHIKGKRIDSHKIDEVPDCLVKTKDSVGCLLDLEDIKRAGYFTWVWKVGSQVSSRQSAVGSSQSAVSSRQ